MLRLALAYTGIVVAMSSPAVTVAVMTIMPLVCVVTGIDKPVVSPFEIVPSARTPVREGVAVASAPGTATNSLFGPDDS
jgi:hypothetical protein